MLGIRIFIFLIFPFVIWLNGSLAIAQQTLVFAKPGPFDYHAHVSEAILIEAYSRLGITVTTKEFPGARALQLSNSGLMDGEVNRIRGIEKRYLNLRIVPVAINSLKGSVFTKNPSINIENWESLRPYSIALRLGAKFAEFGTAGMNVTKLATNELAFGMLDQGRVDVVVSTALEGALTIQRRQFEDIFLLSPPLITLDLYHFLHKKHENLVPKITKILKEMLRNGDMIKIREKSLKFFHRE